MKLNILLLRFSWLSLAIYPSYISTGSHETDYWNKFYSNLITVLYS